jgi:hypothetical protein
LSLAGWAQTKPAGAIDVGGPTLFVLRSSETRQGGLDQVKLFVKLLRRATDHAKPATVRLVLQLLPEPLAMRSKILKRGVAF